MKVLLSIKPEFATKIFNGSKGYEYRRIIFKKERIKTVVVYASDPVKKVIGEFEIGEVLQDNPLSLWAKTKEHAGISKEAFLKYFGDSAKGYAIKITSPKEYDVPLSINSLVLTSPPQSYKYLSD